MPPTLTHLCMMTVGQDQRLYALDDKGRLLEAQWKRDWDGTNGGGRFVHKLDCWVVVTAGVEEKTCSS